MILEGIDTTENRPNNGRINKGKRTNPTRLGGECSSNEKRKQLPKRVTQIRQPRYIVSIDTSSFKRRGGTLLSAGEENYKLWQTKRLRRMGSQVQVHKCGLNTKGSRVCAAKKSRPLGQGKRGPGNPLERYRALELKLKPCLRYVVELPEKVQTCGGEDDLKRRSVLAERTAFDQTEVEPGRVP